MKTFFCHKCSSDVLKTDWYYSVRGRDSMCKSCRKNYRKSEKREHTKKYISERKEHYKHLNDEWRKNNPDYQKKWTKKCPESQLLRSARNRAKQKNMECTITQNDIHIPKICPVFKVPFVKGTEYAPSLDRIDNTKGYTPENIVVVSRKANVMKNNGSVQDLKMLVEYYSKLS
jgi:hypothetical protein